MLQAQGEVSDTLDAVIYAYQDINALVNGAER